MYMYIRLKEWITMQHINHLLRATMKQKMSFCDRKKENHRGPTFRDNIIADAETSLLNGGVGDKVD